MTFSSQWKKHGTLKKILKTIKYVAALFLLLLGFIAQAQILVVGDSLSSAHGIDPELGWVRTLEKRASVCKPPHEVINASISGETAAGGLVRLPGLLKEYKPEHVIIALGGNDGGRGRPTKEIETDLTQMVQLAKQAGAQVMLIEMMLPPGYTIFSSTKFQRMYKRVAKKEKITLIPFFVDDVSDITSKTQPDGIHPTAEAQKEMYSHVWPYVREEIGC